MNILYIAYSCSPYSGSEDRIGWNVPYESSKINTKVCIITKEEHREEINRYIKENNINNLEVYFVDIPKVYKKIFKGPFYSGRLNIWQKRSFKIAKEICIKNKIDIIHQITPVEFRAVGAYDKIKNIKFVLGPIGGGEYIPKTLKSYAKKEFLIEFIRQIVNLYYRSKLKISKKIKKCDYVIYANKETKDFLIGKNKNGDIKPEIATVENNIYTLKRHSIIEENKIIFIVSGRIIYRKGHEFLLDAIEKVSPYLDYELRIIGGGKKINEIKRKVNSNPNLKKHVKILGKMISFEDIYNEYRNADVLIMPSIRETTGTVVLEAMEFGLPVITINKFGAINIVNQENGFLYDGNTKEEMIENLKNIIEYCIQNKNKLQLKKKKALETATLFSFKNKIKYYNEIYKKIMD